MLIFLQMLYLFRRLTKLEDVIEKMRVKLEWY